MTVSKQRGGLGKVAEDKVVDLLDRLASEIVVGAGRLTQYRNTEMRGICGIVVRLGVHTAQVKVAHGAEQQGLAQDVVAVGFLGGIVAGHGRGILDNVVGVSQGCTDTAPDVVGGSSRAGVGCVVVLLEYRGTRGEVNRHHVACYLGILEVLGIVVLIILVVGTHQTGVQTAGVREERRDCGLALLIDGQEAVARGEQGYQRDGCISYYLVHSYLEFRIRH